MAVDELCDLALERVALDLGETNPEQARYSTMGDLFGAVMYGMVNVHTHSPLCTSRPSDQPRAHALVAYQAMRGNVVVNAHHSTVQFEPFSIEVLKMANGVRRTCWRRCLSGTQRVS